jgi:hypothetical protein
LDRQYPDFHSDRQQAIARSDKTEMLQTSNQTWLKKLKKFIKILKVKENNINIITNKRILM